MSSPLYLNTYLNLYFSSCAPALWLMLSWILMKDMNIQIVLCIFTLS